MCNPASFIVTRNDVLFSKTSDSHEDIISENKLRDGFRVNFVRVELCPPEGNFQLPFIDWKFHTDQRDVPDWYFEKDAEERCRKALPIWARHHLVSYSLIIDDVKKDIICYGGDLDLRGTQITELPEGLSVGGDLDLRGTQITELPEGLTVGGYLELRNTQIIELPGGLSVGGDLDLQDMQITELPGGLSVGGYLDLEGTPITELPEGLSVGGYLDLEGTRITELPEGLSVGGNLYLRGTQITELPEGLTVEGKILR